MVEYYKVGGYVRDLLLGVKSKDIDYAVEAESYNEMREDLLKKGVRIFQERPKFFSIRGSHPQYGGVDYTLCRKDGFYSDGRRPDSVESGTIYDDLARRDFTINAIALYEGAKEGWVAYIDPHKGREDIENMYLQCVGDTYERFTEDPLRILRAVRFHLTKGFILSLDIEEAFADQKLLTKLVETTAIERVYEEVYKCFLYDSWKTLMFFRYHRPLENTVFLDIGLGLSPKIPFKRDLIKS